MLDAPRKKLSQGFLDVSGLEVQGLGLVVENTQGVGKLPLANDDPERLVLEVASFCGAGSQLRVIGKHGASADQDGINLTSSEVAIRA